MFLAALVMSESELNFVKMEIQEAKDCLAAQAMGTEAHTAASDFFLLIVV